VQYSAPVVLEYLPAGQSVHVVAPALVEYLPVGQFRHVEALEAPTAVEYLP
jgi:hypothetical protein